MSIINIYDEYLFCRLYFKISILIFNPGIRRFIRELELDGKLYEAFYRRNMARQRTADTDSESDEGKNEN